MKKYYQEIFLITVMVLIITLIFVCGCSTTSNSGCAKRIPYKEDFPCQGQGNSPNPSDMSFYNKCKQTNGYYDRTSGYQYCVYDKCFCSNSPPVEWQKYAKYCLDEDKGKLIVEDRNGEISYSCRYVDPETNEYFESPYPPDL